MLKPYVINTANSKHALMRPVPITSAELDDPFWKPIRERLKTVTLKTQYEQFIKTGRLDNFRRAAGQADIPFRGFFFNDSDVYKWMEAAAWTLAPHTDTGLEALLEEVIEIVEDAQEPDGYLNTYFTHERAPSRWTDLGVMHELYCAGHLIQAGIAHHRSTSRDRLLNVAIRFADHICDIFGSTGGKMQGTGGHEEIEMALVELYRETRKDEYLEQAQYFLDVRGSGYAGGQTYSQDHIPFREFELMSGHAVRMLYLTAGAADIILETGDENLKETLDRLWERLATRQVYISGVTGSHHAGESFGADYQLPNERAYAETCAAIGNLMWNWRMLVMNGDARHADMLETTIYNSILVGLGLDGKSYFYRNPLVDDGTRRRQDWFKCACCPPNLARVLASLPGYFYSLSENRIWMHLFAQSTADLTFPNGRQVKIHQHTDYPWDGEIEITVEGSGVFCLNVRIPAYCEAEASMKVAGEEILLPVQGGSYVEIKRRWKSGDKVHLSLPFVPRLLESHPYIAENTAKTALMRGPLLYCLEGVDHPGIDLRDVHIPDDIKLAVEFRPDLLGGTVGMRGQALCIPPGESWAQRLYRPLSPKAEKRAESPLEIYTIPYYAWANRDPGQMLVWMRRKMGD
jgi:DUF1680 family protein